MDWEILWVVIDKPFHSSIGARPGAPPCPHDSAVTRHTGVTARRSRLRASNSSRGPARGPRFGVARSQPGIWTPLGLRIGPGLTEIARRHLLFFLRVVRRRSAVKMTAHSMSAWAVDYDLQNLNPWCPCARNKFESSMGDIPYITSRPNRSNLSKIGESKDSNSRFLVVPRHSCETEQFENRPSNDKVVAQEWPEKNKEEFDYTTEFSFNPQNIKLQRPADIPFIPEMYMSAVQSNLCSSKKTTLSSSPFTALYSQASTTTHRSMSSTDQRPFVAELSAIERADQEPTPMMSANEVRRKWRSMQAAKLAAPFDDSE